MFPFKFLKDYQRTSEYATGRNRKYKQTLATIADDGSLTDNSIFPVRLWTPLPPRAYNKFSNNGPNNFRRRLFRGWLDRHLLHCQPPSLTPTFVCDAAISSLHSVSLLYRLCLGCCGAASNGVRQVARGVYS